MEMARTVKELRKLLKGLPGDLPVQFEPITDAWLGTMNPVRARSTETYNSAGYEVKPTDRTAELTIYLYEDRTA